jgi:hypothetical protein
VVIIVENRNTAKRTGRQTVHSVAVISPSAASLFFVGDAVPLIRWCRIVFSAGGAATLFTRTSSSQFYFVVGCVFSSVYISTLIVALISAGVSGDCPPAVSVMSRPPVSPWATFIYAQLSAIDIRAADSTWLLNSMLYFVFKSSTKYSMPKSPMLIVALYLCRRSGAYVHSQSVMSRSVSPSAPAKDAFTHTAATAHPRGAPEHHSRRFRWRPHVAHVDDDCRDTLNSCGLLSCAAEQQLHLDKLPRYATIQLSPNSASACPVGFC